MNLAVAVLNWLHLRRPPTCPDEIVLRRPLSSVQRRVVRHIEECLTPWNSISVISAEAMGRTKGKVEEMSALLQRLQHFQDEVLGSDFLPSTSSADVVKPKRSFFAPGLQRASPGDVCGVLPSNVATVAKPIVADRLNFRGRPDFDASPFLDSVGRQIYQDPVATACKPEDSMQGVPSVKIHGNEKETWKLLRKLDQTGRLGLIPEHKVFHGYQAGLFSVNKDESSDRLIFDSRPWNTLETRPKRWIYSMASSSVLCDLILKQDEVCVTSGTDLREFYHSFSATESRLIRNPLLVSAWPWEVRDFACYNDSFDNYNGRLFFGLRTLAMGDSCAVEVAQTAHVGILTQLGLVDHLHLLTMNCAVPRSLSQVGIVIDDLVFFERFSASAFLDGDFTQLSTGNKLDQAVQRYTDLGLIPHPGKTFKFAAEQDFWGCLFDGATGYVRASLKRVAPILMVTLGVIRMGVVSIQLLEVLVGSWTAAFLFRRRLLSLFNVCYAAIQATDDRASVIRLSYELKVELFLCCALAPLACTFLKTPPCRDVFASDASDWGIATVKSPLPDFLVSEIHRHRLRRNVWTKLLKKALLRARDDLVEELELPEGLPLQSHPLWITLARGLQFEVVTKKKSRDGVRIMSVNCVACCKWRRMHAKVNFPLEFSTFQIARLLWEL